MFARKSLMLSTCVLGLTCALVAVAAPVAPTKPGTVQKPKTTTSQPGHQRGKKHAASQPGKGKHGKRNKPVDSGNGLASLQQAYGLLAKADHDYQGHRAKAMHAIRAACHMLGAKEPGDGKGGEQQVASDQQLKQAQQLLQAARGAFAQQKNPRILKHIDAAIAQINAALAVK